VWCAKGSLTKTVNKSSERLVLMWAVASEVSGKHVGEGVEAVNGVWQKGGKPFEGRAFKGGRKGLAENNIMESVEGDVGDVDLEVFVWVGLTGVAFQCERFPLGKEGGAGNEISKRMTAPRLGGW